MRAPPPPVVVIGGATGSGKSALALDVARAVGGTIVNADSMQIYAELRILTARPTAAEEALAPHRLFGVMSVRERCSAGRWLPLAVDAIAAARADGRVPIVVGGTGLYLKALIEGLSVIPAVAPAVREEARSILDDGGEAAFRARLRALDPVDGDRAVPPGDRQRLIRSMEVLLATGRSLPDWHRRAPPVASVRARFAVLTLEPDAQTLNPALDRRFDRMLASGALDEARALLALGLDSALPAMKAVGVRELLSHLRGERSLKDATEAAKGATRRFAKRQRTWLRHQLQADRRFDEQYSERIWQKILPFIREFLLTRAD
jgi:tRNA dimethylallyltransferase